MSSTEIEDISFDLPKNQSNVIKVIGVGGGGSNAINHMFQQGIKGVDFVICNTDAQALENSPVPIKIQLGVNLTEGLGAGANPQIGEQAALESFEDLKSMLDTNTKMVFITAGMGGGTGTGAAPIIAKQAKDMEILTVGIVTIPFQFEGKTRNEQAQIGVEKLRSNVDSLIVINNNKLREVYGNLGFKAGFSKADEVLATASRGIAEVITHHYTQNIDLRDAKTVLSNSGTAIMGSAAASGSNRANEAIAKALDSPLLNDNKITGAKNVLLLIVSGSQEITIDEIGEINDHIQAEAGHSANIIMGVGDDEKLDESISVTIIATGFDVEQQNEIVNTETRKIIHTLEDEQKAEQELFPREKVSSPTKRNQPSVSGRQPLKNKIVHTLEEEEDFPQEKKSENSETEMEMVPTTELLRNLEVDYEEVKYNEDDFVIIDTSDSLRDIDVDSPEEIQPVSEDQTMFSFDFPMNNESSKKEKKEEPNQRKPEKRESEKSEKIIFDLSDDTKDIEVREEIEIVPISGDDGSKRYSLDDYMEFEQEMENAKPRVKTVNEPKEEIVFEKKTLTDKETKTKNEPEENDPFDNPISEDLIARAAERRAKMKNFNYKFRNKQGLDEIEKQPAYKRAGIELNDGPQKDKMSRTSLEEDENDEPKFRSNNSFLHDNVD
ncbi:MAG TPA: cell division protein FtsZ [Flavobacteriaceae bacterium]|nr:cell division protein FtsZ [Flavobacteriaceae bacterium]